VAGFYRPICIILLNISADKIIKKTLKIGFLILGMVLAMLFLSYLVLRSPVAQTFLTQKLAKHLSSKYKTNISIQGVSIAFFNKVVLEKVLVEDQKRDSLLFVDRLEATLDSLNIRNLYFGIGNLKLDKTSLHLDVDSAGTANYRFLLDQLRSRDTLKTDSLNIDFIMNKFEFNDAKLRYGYVDSTGNRQLLLNDIWLNVSDIKYIDEKMSFEITGFRMNNHEGLSLKNLSAKLETSSDSITVRQLQLQTSNSVITEANIQIDKSKIGRGLDLKKLRVNLELKKSEISLEDLAQLVPDLKGMDEKMELMGQISGSLADLKGKNMEVGFGENTRVAFDFYLNGLPDISKTYMHFDLKQSSADFNDLRKVKLPGDLTFSQLKIPEVLYEAGVVQYKGNFTGFLDDFVAFGTFRSKWGVLTTDLSFVPSEGENLRVNGKLKSVDFQLGQLFQSEVLDGVTFNGNIQGVLNPKTQNFNAKVAGQIDSVMVNQYKYKNIKLNGDILNKRFDGNLVVDDQNLKFRFDGKFDLNVPVPVFNFTMLVEKADLKAMNVVGQYKESEVSFALNANFTGSNIDNLAGDIHFQEGFYKNENGEVDFNDFDLKTFNDNEPVLQVRSDFLNADIRGQYQLHNLYYSIKEIIAHYLPSSGLSKPAQKTNNNFDFRLVFLDINRFARVLAPNWRIDPVTVEGSINSTGNSLVLKADFPLIQYKSTIFHHYHVTMDGGPKLNMRNKVDEIEIGETFKVYNLSLLTEAAKDVLDSKLAWNNYGQVSYSGSVNTSTKFFKQKNYPHIEIAVKPTRIYLADSLWQINSSLITVDSTMIKVDKFRLSNKGQSITASGSIDKGQSDKLNILFNRIDLRSLNSLVAGNLKLKGELDGTLSLFDIYERALYLADLKVDGLGILGEPIGNASIQSRWDRDEEEIDAELLVYSDQRNSLHAFGSFNPGKDSLSINANFDRFSLLILQPLMGSSFSNFHGDASGKVRIYGSPGHIQHDGALYASNAGLMLSELQVNYTLNDSVKFSGDKIIFPDIRIQDDFNNSGVFTGSIQHQSFRKMVYDMTIRSNRIMAINTTPAINEQFYGTTFGSGVVRITGKGATVFIDGVARTERGTEMNISLEYEGDAQEYDFLTFVTHAYQPKFVRKNIPAIVSNVQMRFNVEVTPEARAQLIYNSKIGDVIRSQGSGNLQLSIDNDYNISLFGEYTVQQGDYLFTLQNVINKKFEIQQGGTIEWNGDPMDATINLNAIYRLKASLSKFFSGTDSPDARTDYNQRVNVLCKINLTNNLNNPDIQFDIEMPSTDDRIRDEVKQYINSEEDRNKQILSLLVLGEFYTPEHLRGTETYAGSNTNLVGSTASTASELFSNQFSNWLSQISNDFDIGFNYRPGNAITNDEIEFALSTQMFNDRVTINGNIGNNSQRTNANNNGLVGDADITVKLTNNGKLLLKTYNQSNNMIYETSPYTQGVGLSYREDFNDFDELWQKLMSLFRWRFKKV